jgi:predicted TIM-barrel fold metal-dependent hydrolase
VLNALPDDAAAEIRRDGGHERIVAVALGMNGLSRPFGHPAYHPIYAAAAELDLPLVIQVGCDASPDLLTTPIAAGLPATYAEYDAMSAQPFMGHVTSMILSGVFQLWPNLRLLLVGGGVAWVPSFLWRMDQQFRFTRRVEAPWLDEPPSEVFMRHVRLTTYSLETPRQPERLERLLRTLPEPESLLLYASGYPNVDGEPPESVAARLPAEWHDAVFGTNAASFFRWPDRAAAALAGGVAATDA